MADFRSEERGGSPQQTGTGGFDFNQPTIIALLYLVAFIGAGFTPIIGVVLAYVWRREPKAAWEASHYAYLIRTFWILFVSWIVVLARMVLLVRIPLIIGFPLLIAVFVLVFVRSVLSLVNAQKGQPMPNPDSWWV